MGSQHNELSIETAYGVGVGMSGVLPTHATPHSGNDKNALLHVRLSGTTTTSLAAYMACATGNNRFAKCKNIYRVHYIWHSIKKLFVNCCKNHTRQNNGTRQTISLLSA